MGQITLELRVLTDIISRLIKRDLEKRLGDCGLNLSSLQHSVLRMLSTGEYSASEIGRRLFHELNTLGPAIEGLERTGLIQRQRDPLDRRRSALILTEAGRQVLQEIPILDPEDTLNELLGRLGPSRAQELLETMRLIAAHLAGDEAVIANISQAIGQIVITSLEQG